MSFTPHSWTLISLYLTRTVPSFLTEQGKRSSMRAQTVISECLSPSLSLSFCSPEPLDVWLSKGDYKGPCADHKSAKVWSTRGAAATDTLLLTHASSIPAVSISCRGSNTAMRISFHTQGHFRSGNSMQACGYSNF